jgi:hypothetical protein
VGLLQPVWVLCGCCAGAVRVLCGCCAGDAAIQAWTLEPNGNLHLSAKKGACLALQGGGGPGTVVAQCKVGTGGANEMWTIAGGQLCSHSLHSATGAQLCLKVEAGRPSGGGGGGGGASGFNCIANPAALARCQVHFTMWTIMKAPLLLGNDIRQMDPVALAVV